MEAAETRVSLSSIAMATFGLMLGAAVIGCDSSGPLAVQECSPPPIQFPPPAGWSETPRDSSGSKDGFGRAVPEWSCPVPASRPAVRLEQR